MLPVVGGGREAGRVWGGAVFQFYLIMPSCVLKYINTTQSLGLREERVTLLRGRRMTPAMSAWSLEMCQKLGGTGDTCAPPTHHNLCETKPQWVRV